jgi:hypothetical protein
MTNNSTLKFAGEYFLTEVTIITADNVESDITNQVGGIVLYEDLFSPFISGTIFIKDTFDLPGLFGRSGLNRVRLDISTPTIEKQNHISATFHIYKHSDRVLTGDRSQQYSFHFISEESIPNQKKISKSYSGSPSELVNRIVRDEFRSRKPVYMTPSTNSTKYVSNFWTPTQNITFLSEHSRSSNGDNYIFFENRDGFNFLCLNDLANRQIKPLQEFSNIDSIGRNGQKDINLDYQTIISINVDTIFDYIRDLDSGIIKSKLYISDPVLKRFKIKNFELSTDKKQLLNKNRLYTDKVVTDSEFTVMNGIRQYNTMSSGDASNFEYYQRRLSQIRQFQSSKVEIEVLGRTDYTVGKKVHLDINKIRSFTDGDDQAEFQDKILSGYYIISAVAHKFSLEKHICSLELIKDSTESE